MTTIDPASDNAHISEIAGQMKLAMRRLAASVSVISAANRHGDPFAMTATSVTSLSLEPPALLICVSSWAAIHQALSEGQPFCVNILNNKQQSIAEICSQGPENRDRFAIGNWQFNADNTPYIADAQANLFCVNDKSICYASHTIFIGQVDKIGLCGDVSPLVYLDGNYLHCNPEK